MATKEPQYNSIIKLKGKKGLNQLGIMMNQVWDADPKRLVFVLSRYKFVSKMLAGKRNVLEVGCGDAWASRIVKQTVKNLTVSDFDPLLIEDAKSRSDQDWQLTYLVHDITIEPTRNRYDAVYAVDVFEHIDKNKEDAFLENICASLKEDGCAIIGMPSLESQLYASEASRQGHVNCKTGKDFKEIMERYFTHAFVFSMNDEVVSTGFEKMANYLFCLCCGVR